MALSQPSQIAFTLHASPLVESQAELHRTANVAQPIPPRYWVLLFGIEDGANARRGRRAVLTVGI